MPRRRAQDLPTVPEDATAAQILDAELDQDPLSWGYASMSDQEATDRLNYVAKDTTDPLARVSDTTTFDTATLFEAFDKAEMDVKLREAVDQKAAYDKAVDDGVDPTTLPIDRWNAWVQLLSILQLSFPIPIAAPNTQARILDFFSNPGSGTTRQNLADMRVTLVSRATELTLPFVKVGYVERVRAA